MKRQKLVFGSHSQLAHVWAQQKQESGRASRMFFENTTDIYSYGRHYLAARIHKVKGTTFALVRSDPYSVSTGGHLSDIRRALQDLMPYFRAPSITDPRLALKHLDAEAQNTVGNALKTIKCESAVSKRYVFERIHDAFKEANKLRKILGRAEVWPKKKQLDAVENHLDFRIKRYKELNTPEMIAKRDAEREKRAVRKALKETEKRYEDVRRWRAGENVGRLNTQHAFLRIRGDVVQTSGGAEVPLKAARVLYEAIKAGKDVAGVEIGNFTVNEATRIKYDTDQGMPREDVLIRVGCHRILLSEAAQLFDK